MIEKALKFFFKIFFKFFFSLGKPPDPLIQRTIDLYRGDSFTNLFAKIRFWDSPFEKLEKIIPKSGVIWDLGCGDGILTNYLALTSQNRKLIGVELNRERLKLASKGLKNTTFLPGDVMQQKIVSADVILMIHLLHHLHSFQDQEVLIKKCARQLKKGGKIIILEIEKNFTLKFLITLMVDYLIFPILFEKKLLSSKIYYRSATDWQKLLVAEGLRVKIMAAESGNPFSHVIIKCQKDSGQIRNSVIQS